MGTAGLKRVKQGLDEEDPLVNAEFLEPGPHASFGRKGGRRPLLRFHEMISIDLPAEGIMLHDAHTDGLHDMVIDVTLQQDADQGVLRDRAGDHRLNLLIRR